MGEDTGFILFVKNRSADDNVISNERNFTAFIIIEK